ncbi:MAG: hypothetical protein ABR569_15305 [Gaiellaceae bacterium]
MPSWFGLVLALVSAIMVNWAYTLEHDAAAVLPRLTARRPIHSARLLLRNRAWLRGFGTETAGWLVYVAALRLAPLALVQAVSAAGIAVLALVTARGHPRRLARHEQIAVLVAMAGLALLGLSLTEVQPSDHRPNGAATAVWLAAVIGGALTLTAVRVQLSRVAALGLAAGLLFAGGDMSAKLVVYGGAWLLALFPLVLSYGLGTSVLQGAFQRGNALTSAGIATLATNAVPIAAGFVLFDEALPQGYRAPVQIAAFASIVLSAVLLGRPRPQRERGDGG